MTEFVIWTSYHPPLGFEKKGRNEFYWLSRCGRWYVRRGNRNTMIVKDKDSGTVHVVNGKMPEVEKFVSEKEKGSHQ